MEIAGVRVNMKNKLMPFYDKMMLRKRYIIETINNSSLKFEIMAKRLYAAQPKSSLTVSRCSKLIAYMNFIKRLCFQMPLRPLLAHMPSSHRSCSPLHSLFGAEHTDQNMA